MPKAQIAELILSLFTTRERAASTVGDLIENAPGRGTRWFWSGVSRTALSLFWCSFAAEPAFIAGIAFRGLMLNLTLYLALLLCILLFAAVFGIVFGVVVASHSASSPAVANLSTGAFPVQLGLWVSGRTRSLRGRVSDRPMDRASCAQQRNRCLRRVLNHRRDRYAHHWEDPVRWPGAAVEDGRRPNHDRHSVVSNRLLTGAISNVLALYQGSNALTSRITATPPATSSTASPASRPEPS